MHALPMWGKIYPPEIAKRAERELGETPDTRKKAIQELRELIDGEVGFHPVLDDSFLLRFIRVRKYDVNRAFKTLKNYYAHKTKHWDIFNFHPYDVKSVLEQNHILVSSTRAANGEGVFICSPGACDYDIFPREQFIGAAFMAAEIASSTELCQVCGCIAIIDVKGLTWKKMRLYTSPTIISLIIKGVQECAPYRLSGIHMVNEPYYFSFAWNIMKPLLSKKMRERVHFHGSDLDSLRKYFSPEILPVELGGTLGNKEFQEFREHILNSESLIEKYNTFVYEGVSWPKKSNDGDTFCKEKRDSLTKRIFRKLSLESDKK